jgi:hypothetical protein
LNAAGRFDEREELTLFRLAIPEMYLATRRFMETGAALVA